MYLRHRHIPRTRQVNKLAVPRGLHPCRLHHRHDCLYADVHTNTQHGFLYCGFDIRSSDWFNATSLRSMCGIPAHVSNVALWKKCTKQKTSRLRMKSGGSLRPRYIVRIFHALDWLHHTVEPFISPNQFSFLFHSFQCIFLTRNHYLFIALHGYKVCRS